MPPVIRSASHEDLPAIVEIYNEGGVATTASYDVEPATLEERTAWFERLRNQGHPVLVLEEEGRYRKQPLRRTYRYPKVLFWYLPYAPKPATMHR